MIDLLHHSLEVLRFVPGPTLDPEGEDLGHPAGTEIVAGTFRGQIQPISARERASAAGRDASVGTYRIFLEPAAIGVVTPDSVISKSGAPDADLDGRYSVVVVRNAAGIGHHLELDANRIT